MRLFTEMLLHNDYKAGILDINYCSHPVEDMSTLRVYITSPYSRCLIFSLTFLTVLWHRICWALVGCLPSFHFISFSLCLKIGPRTYSYSVNHALYLSQFLCVPCACLTRQYRQIWHVVLCSQSFWIYAFLNIFLRNCCLGTKLPVYTCSSHGAAVYVFSYHFELEI